MSNVTLPKNVNTNKFKYSAPKTLSNGSRTVYVNYEGERLTLQTPLMTLPYGVGTGYNADGKDKDEEASNVKKYEINVSFKGADEHPALGKMLEKMKEIDNKIKSDCFENRLTWLRDDYDGLKSVVDRLYYPTVKYSKDKDTGKVNDQYPPTMKLKVPYDVANDVFNFECTDMDGNDLDFKTVLTNLKGAKARFIIQLSGIWMAGGKYGCTWKIVKARIEQTHKVKVNFVEDSDDEHDAKTVLSDEDVEQDAIQMAAHASPVAAKKATPTTVVDESEEEEEDEDEDEDEEEDIPPPPPAPTKKKPTVPRTPTPDPDVDSELEEEDVPPPPPPKRSTKAKAAK